MATAAEYIKLARLRAGLSQTELAASAGVTQSVISSYESGKREPSFPLLERLIRAAGFDLHVDLKPLVVTDLRTRLARNRVELLTALHALGAENVRVFGSIARGDEHEDSDVDLLVDLHGDVGVFAVSRMRGEAERILGAPVDIVPAGGLKPAVAAEALAAAVPL
ncbi:helix-turn-helix domain-containing protein [Rathayibacter soli]|uniref:helix-turn-helix domain-containing protein n=1 Tax=Rathayibacter soli TaxID=3144168 RepID=UPI0027E4E246|nr:helix-turn-helix domain-containing protein [Glaciibacter superstes]